MKFNSIVGNDYPKLVATMLQCAAHENLPQVLEIKDITKVTLPDICNLIKEFTNETGLVMTFSADQDELGYMHCSLFVNYPEADEVFM